MNKYPAFRIAEYIILCLVLLNIMLYCTGMDVNAAEASDYYRECLEFDKDGNLIMTTRDLKATSNTTYRTIGWTIKRYDMPIGAPGQKHAVIRLRECDVVRQRDDPDDPRYVFCYFYGDKDEIWDAIGRADSEWQSQLKNYGDTVYIDDISTVCVNGNPLGSLNDNSGNISGEVYFTYEGISNARAWASPESLRTHFDKNVTFPAIVKVKKYYSEESIVNNRQYNSSMKKNVHIGQGEKGKSVYRISDGVPTGEDVYIDGMISKYQYNISLEEIKLKAHIPVKINTVYHLNWVDYYGVTHTEDKTAVRYYIVNRSSTYWKITALDFKYLDNLDVHNYSFSAGHQSISSTYRPKIINKDIHGEKDIDKEVTVYTDGGNLNGSEGRKPSIPDANQQSIADKSVGKIDTRNDYLKIDNITILDNSNKQFDNSFMSKLISESEFSFYSKGHSIPHSKKNGLNYESYALANYVDYHNNKKSPVRIDNVNSVSILTPTVCHGVISNSRLYNQQITPTNDISTLIIGMNFKAGVNTYGEHRDFLGYGKRDYAETTEKKQVCFPFDVYGNNRLITQGTWIDVDTLSQFYLPIGVPEGIYDIRYRALSSNYKAEEKAEYMSQHNANMEYSSYCATDSVSVHVLGRLYGLSITDNQYVVGKRDCNGKANGREKVLPYVNDYSTDIIPLKVTTIGNLHNSKDNISINVKYYMYNQGKREEVSVYYASMKDDSWITLNKMCNNICIDSSSRTYCGEQCDYGCSDKTRMKKGMQLWSGSIKVPAELYVFNDSTLRGDSERLRTDYVAANRVRSGNIIINFDIETVSNGNHILSYINNKNYSAGYCNMWKTEGGRELISIQSKRIKLLDGDAIICPLGGDYKEDYRVVGTH